MLIRTNITVKAFLLTWLLAEAVTYALVLAHCSALVALSIGIGSTALGLLVLRLVGRKFAREPAISLKALDSLSDLKAIPWALFGAILLLLPGFLSDLAGLILVLLGARSFSQAHARRYDERQVDLSPDEWTRLPDDESSK